MVIFGTVPKVGKLTLEKVLFEFDKEPIVFVCLDEKRKRYLCLCTDNILSYSWMIAQVDEDILIRLIKDEISVYEAFQRSEKDIVIAEKKGEKFSYKRRKFEKISEDDLPDKNEKLENPYLKEYLDELKKNMIYVKLMVPEGYEIFLGDYCRSVTAIKRKSSWSVPLVCANTYIGVEMKREKSTKRKPATVECPVKSSCKPLFLGGQEFVKPKSRVKEFFVCG